MANPAIRAVVIDIEGTTTPISFVHDVLFPFARTHLPALVRTGAFDPAVAAELAAIEEAAPGSDPVTVLMGWMDTDAKHTPLKTLQGLVWRQGYAEGALKGMLYPDVAPRLRKWHAAGCRLFVYSSGSTEAQRLLFGHSDAGDLTGLFDGFFDTRIGAKRSSGSYQAIGREIGLPVDTILFLSDVEEELDAAVEASLVTCQLVRPMDKTAASERHPTADDFMRVEELFDLVRWRA
ncbi:acireductone synthase [Acidisphaera sp. L21]|uniref:acireductone synthase n=1 Tax=Acidisphaera sp. L21 TaxID=1641851 RepID=UPI00131E24DF|nr:acireductone synthase [Acidisphaera sp. L21]